MIIKSSNGFDIIIDEDDFCLIKNHIWRATKSGYNYYAYANNHGGRLGRTTIKLHRIILGLKNPNDCVDHLDGNGLNNQKSNLRVVPHSENMKNKKIYKNSTTGCQGISFKNGKYIARIQADRKRFFLGSFLNIEDAVLAYKQAAKKYNFIDRTTN